MSKIVVATVTTAALVIAAVGPSRVFAASTGPGKKSAFESSDFSGSGDIPQAVATLLTATIAKGKKKNVLVVEVMLSTGSSASSFLYLRTDVNGYEIEPLSGGSSNVRTYCSGTPCTLTAARRLDLDAAEAAHPGVFINQPLTVTLRGGEGLLGSSLTAGSP